MAEEMEKSDVEQPAQISHSNMDKEKADQKQEEKTEAQAPRENLVSTAVHFLQNPRVQASPLSQKRAFLSKKGLTSEEIDLAIERAQASIKDQSTQQVTTYPGPSHLQPAPIIHPVPVPTAWDTFRNVSSSVVLVGVACYGLYYVYKRYIEPFILGKSCNEEEDRLDQVQKHLGELTSAVQQLKGSIASLKETLNSQKALKESESIEIIKQDVTLTDLKSEVSSIKALLLSRKQFPSNPVPTPTIPFWQLPAESTTKPDEESKTNEIEDGECGHSMEPEELSVKVNGVTSNDNTQEITVE